MRALGIHLPGLSRKTIERRPYPPGEHGQKRRRKPSEHGRQLQEKQKLRFHYGVSERQLRRMVKESRRGDMASGKKLMQLLERRLDNVLFRSGFGPTIPAARQLCSHGHFLVNNRRTNVPSFRVSVGDVIQLRNKSMKMEIIEESMAESSLFRPDWLDVDRTKKSAQVMALPTVDTVPFELDLQAVVEFYSKLV